MTPNDLLAAGYRMARRMLHIMCDDLTADEFHYQPVPGANNAAWIVGHLAVTVRRAAERLGATGLPVLTEEFIAGFSQTKKPAGDQSTLGDKTELLALLDVSIDKLMEAVLQLPTEALLNPPPTVGSYATNFGEAGLFGAMHVTMHCGQLSSIRRSLGKPPLV